MRAVSVELKALYARRQMKSRLRSDRDLLCRQYGDFSLVLKSLAADPPGREERRLERKLDDFLREYAPGTECGVYRDRNRRLHVELRGTGAGVLPLREGWLRRLSGALEVELVWAEPGTEVLLLDEAEPLEAEVGLASAGKAGREPCGDYARFFKTREGYLYLLLTDGMGTGESAAREGSEAGLLAERLLRAGLEPEAVLRLLNTALMLRCEKRICPASLDLMRVDLFSGETLVYKYGAAPSYVRLGEGVQVLQGRTRAAGLSLEGPDLTRLRLEPGSAAVILSDGAARAEVVRQKLLESRPGGMKALAGEILTDAAARAGWEDDMTVLTLSLERRRET
jgi:stage II sporulation protein E